MYYFASYFVLFLAIGALLGFAVGYVYRGMRTPAVAAVRDERVTAPPAVASDELAQLPGMTPDAAQRLSASGVGDLASLRSACADDTALNALADATRLEDFALRKWVGIAAMQGLEGVDGDLAHALVRTGVRSVAELAQANPDRVQNKLAALNEAESLLAQVPGIGDIKAIIERAAAVQGPR